VASDTVGEGLARFSQYYPLAHPGAKVSLKISDGIAKFGFPTDQPKDSDGSTGRRIFIEYMLGILSQVLRGLGTRPVVPCEVFFSQREPAFADEYTRFFGAPVRFGAAEDGFALGSAQLAIRLRTANPAMLQKLEEHLAQLQAKHAALQTLSGQVRCAVESALQERIPSAEKVAKQLGMSVRTLTRRLDAEGTSYKKLLDEVRAALAARYLHDGKHSAEQVALLLGFSETSAFLRAFKRWHGTSLTEYRRKPDEQAISADHLPRRKSRN
jgi:AraC-like DNA-binding protein